jgi:ribosomal protein S18 acetylase RimI-like enzyme
LNFARLDFESSFPMPSPTPTLRHVTDSSAPGCDAVREWLRAHNWRENAPYMEQLTAMDFRGQPLVILAETDAGVVGGLFAETQLKWLRISIMAVHPEQRGRGIGAALLAAAEQEARARGCRRAHVDTMSYQAPEFYQAHGFEIAGELRDWDSHGHAKYHFVKELE